MFDDVSKTIKSQLYERVSSPLLISFVSSWLAWNYRFVMTVTSSLPLTEKFSVIDTQIFPTLEKIFLHGSVYPLCTALLLIFVYPIPAKFVYEHWRRQQRELKEIQQRIDDETPLSNEEAREIRREALKVSIEYDKEIQSKSAEIARLKEIVEELQVQSPSGGPDIVQSKAPETTQSAPVDLDESQLLMLDQIARSPNGIFKKPLMERSGDDNVLAEYNLGELIRGEFVTTRYSSPKGDYFLAATHSGRALLVRQGRQ
jgi:hypothetical protein